MFQAVLMVRAAEQKRAVNEDNNAETAMHDIDEVRDLARCALCETAK